MSLPDARVTHVAELLLARTLQQPPTLGTTRLLCIDGRAGSGKTTLAGAVAGAATAQGCEVSVVHMDDIYEGWAGLARTMPRVAGDLVEPLAQGKPGRWQRYDWAAGRLAEWHTVTPVPLLVLEGVGSAASCYDDRITTLVWVDAPRELRIARGLARDGEQVRPYWMAWMEDEDALFARERTRERADVIVDGTGVAERAVVFA